MDEYQADVGDEVDNFSGLNKMLPRSFVLSIKVSSISYSTSGCNCIVSIVNILSASTHFKVAFK